MPNTACRSRVSVPSRPHLVRPVLPIVVALVALSAACRPSEPARAAEPPATPAPAASSSSAPATATGTRGQVAAELATLLTEIKAADKGQLAVSEEDGQFLRMLVASTGRKRALEIGAASGYSAIWIGMGLRDTGGTPRHDRIRPGARARSGGERAPGRALTTSSRSSPATPSRRFRSWRARSTASSWTPGSVTTSSSST